MKLTSVALFCFTSIVAATAQDFLQPDGPLFQKLKPTEDPNCIKDCGTYVDKKDCPSICSPQPQQFRKMINEVFKLIEKPICDVTLSKLNVGQVVLPLKIENDDRNCYLTGILVVLFNKKDTDVTSHHLNYMGYSQHAEWTIEFRGLTLKCSKAPAAGIPETETRVDITVDFSFDQFFWLDPSNPKVQFRNLNKVASFKYPLGAPKGISQKDLEAALKNTIENAEVMNSLFNYFGTLSMTLLTNCVFAVCKPQCPANEFLGR